MPTPKDLNKQYFIEYIEDFKGDLTSIQALIEDENFQRADNSLYTIQDKLMRLSNRFKHFLNTKKT